MVRQFSAGGVVYRKIGEEFEFLLCENSWLAKSSPDYAWGFPKGWLDDAAEGVPGPYTLGQKRATSEEVKASALREVREEAGIEAEIVSRLGTSSFVFTDDKKQKIYKTVIYFLMLYLTDIPGGHDFETSQIAWLPYSLALKRLKKRKGDGDILTRAHEILTPTL